jgi:DNA-binding transcriptional regulator YdaS (Cro superfamily)
MSTPLQTFMDREKIGDADFAALIGKDRTLVNRLRRGLVRPTLDVASQIETVTKGEIPMQSWVDAA